jgi:predicted Holliday junction resolvase-like endonuclease
VSIGSLVYLGLLALAAITITVLIIMYAQLQARLTQSNSELQRAHAHVTQTLDQLTQANAELSQLQNHMNNRVQQLLVEWRDRELESARKQLWEAALSEARNVFTRWKMEAEESIRADAIKRSSAVVAGKITEHLIPHMGLFPYNPKDVRFLGSPVDLIVFDGMDEGSLRQVVCLEVKTGAGTLTTRERRIRDVVAAGQVAWQELRVAGQ